MNESISALIDALVESRVEVQAKTDRESALQQQMAVMRGENDALRKRIVNLEKDLREAKAREDLAPCFDQMRGPFAALGGGLGIGRPYNSGAA